MYALLVLLTLFSVTVARSSSKSGSESGSSESDGSSCDSSRSSDKTSEEFFRLDHGRHDNWTVKVDVRKEYFKNIKNKFKPREPTGPLYNFIKKLCSILKKFKQEDLVTYFDILSCGLRDTGSGFLMRRAIKKFRRSLKHSATTENVLLAPKVQSFWRLIKNPSRIMKTELFRRWNCIYTSDHEECMQAYLDEVERYGTERVTGMLEKTKSVFNNVIFNAVYQLKKQKREELLLQFKLALQEYNDTTPKGPKVDPLENQMKIYSPMELSIQLKKTEN